MMDTRPDIAYAVSVVSRYSSLPNDEHWKAVKRIFRYLRSIINLQLTLSGSTDADWTGDQDTLRSTSGYVFNTGGGAISWSTKR